MQFTVAPYNRGALKRSPPSALSGLRLRSVTPTAQSGDMHGNSSWPKAMNKGAVTVVSTDVTTGPRTPEASALTRTVLASAELRGQTPGPLNSLKVDRRAPS
jgi:hypothetical protein